LNVLKDDLIVRLDQFSSEMLILREEIKSLQTVKAALQLRISELEEEAKKSREELANKTRKQEEEEVCFRLCLLACMRVLVSSLITNSLRSCLR
jgi:uncharacterized protein YlxW (UPF0749 family)